MTTLSYMQLKQKIETMVGFACAIVESFALRKCRSQTSFKTNILLRDNLISVFFIALKIRKGRK